MPISSLPSPYGIGTLGKAAYEFVDFLKEAKQSWWQLLPVGPTSHGDSPYQSFSTYAGNPYFVDLDTLCEEGLVTQEELDAMDWGSNAQYVDYEKIYQSRFVILKKAMDRGWNKHVDEIQAFIDRNHDWLPDYALYMAVKRHFGMKAWTEWDEDIRMRRPEAVKRYQNLLAEDMRLFAFIQYLFFRQWEKLRAYAHKNGIGIIGDMPIYVAMDSADVWSDPKSFQLDEKNVPVEVAGVPPDYFSADGQLWGNPLYDWDAMKEDGYSWWIRRIGGAAKLYDVLRIDHFRGLESYWSVPYGETTAKNGKWVKGPGMDFIAALQKALPNLELIAEDLGFLTQEVLDLRDNAGLPGMKILEFAFDSREPSDYLPYNCPVNSVCYTGTHDNMTMRQWFDTAPADAVAYATEYMMLTEQEGLVWGVIRTAMSTPSRLCIVQLQDYLDLGGEARMNFPGTQTNDNWTWRATEGMITDALAKKIHRMTVLYGRVNR